TNQFILTTRRYSATDLERFAREPGTQILSLRVRDCFGDAGQVGVAICLERGSCVYLDTFLLSCRVIGRGIESALLAYVAEEARDRKSTRLNSSHVSISY